MQAFGDGDARQKMTFSGPRHDDWRYRCAKEEAAILSAIRFRNYFRREDAAALLKEYESALQGEFFLNNWETQKRVGLQHLAIMTHIVKKDPALGTRLFEMLFSHLHMFDGMTFVNIWMKQINDSHEVIRLYREIKRIMAPYQPHGLMAYIFDHDKFLIKQCYAPLRSIIENRILEIEFESKTPVNPDVEKFLTAKRSAFHRFSRHTDAGNIYRLIKEGKATARDQYNRFVTNLESEINAHLIKMCFYLARWGLNIPVFRFAATEIPVVDIGKQYQSKHTVFFAYESKESKESKESSESKEVKSCLPKSPTLFKYLDAKQYEKFNFYERLGLEPESENLNDLIKRAYRQRAPLYHPDQNRDDTVKADFIFKALQEAYETLSDANKRLIYNAKIRKPEGVRLS